MNECRESIPLSPIATRVVFLLDQFAGGSQRRFAALLGCSHATVSKIATGRTEPGGKILHLIGGLANVNQDWLRTGTGDPFLVPRSITGVPTSIPIAKTLIPGLVRNHSNLWTSRALYLPASICTELTYAVEAQFAAPASMMATERMLLGDLLVIDGDDSLWRPSPEWLIGRLAVIARSGVAELQRVKTVIDRQRVEIEDAAATMPQPRKKPVRDLLLKDFDNLPEPETAKVEKTVTTAPQLNDIVGVATQLVRIY